MSKMTPHLKMSFDPQTIEHLGVKMYSQIPNAIAELIANAFDADAHNVQVKLYDKGSKKSIHVIDDGVGMDFDDINTKFLRIGRNRRKDGANKSPSGKRKATGKKGLGKLALFGIGDIIEISTIKKGTGKQITFTLDWEVLIGTTDKDYQPKYTITDCDKKSHGTTIILKKLRRESPFDKDGLAVSLSKLFNFFDVDFSCLLSLNDGEAIQVTNDLKYKNIESQFEWIFPDFTASVEEKFSNSKKITGKIISTEKPIKPGLRGITLFANGRMVNAPEFFGIPESSHVFSYITGWLDINFIDDTTEDVISTNRQSLNWELPGIAELRIYLVSIIRKIVIEWRAKRKEAKVVTIGEQTHIDTTDWFGKLPNEIRGQVESLVEAIIDETDVATESQAKVIDMIHGLVPEYPYYHWRHIHAEVRDASKIPYENKDYYTAFLEAAKRYANKVRTNSKGNTSDDHPMMGAVFGSEKGVAKLLSVTKGYKRPNGTEFNKDTLENIENGQRELSQGIIRGCRNPVTHEEHADLKVSKLFDEKDCLDALSLLSHLFKRLDDAIKP